MKCLALALVLTCSTTAEALAQTTGEELYDFCTQTNDDVAEYLRVLNYAKCAFYLQGTVDTFRILNDVNKLRIACLPKQGLSLGFIIRLFVTWMQAHPDERQDGAKTSVISALHQRFPCGPPPAQTQPQRYQAPRRDL